MTTRLPRREPAGTPQGSYLLKGERGDQLPEQQRRHHEAERGGAFTFSRAVIPGPLQTQEYAEAVITAACHARGGAATYAAETARLRMDRVAALHANPDRYIMLMDAGALTTLVGTLDVMRAQLANLARTISQLPGRTIGIIPTGHPQPLANHDFTIHPQRQRVVIELVHAELELDDARTVRRYGALFEKLTLAAVYDQPAADLIAGILSRRS